MNAESIRPDVAALTDEALVLVTNRGLVKRAVRMVEENPPDLSASIERIVARFADGVVTELPASLPFTDASCSCGASSACRHRLGLVLAYRARFGTDVGGPEWTPGEFDDTLVESHVGAAAMRRARRIRGEGYQATVHRPEGTDSIVRVELPHCTVRFLTPHDVGHTHSSASEHAAPESIALAVWAVREADESGSDEVFVSSAGLIQDSANSALAKVVARTILVDGLAGASGVQHASAVRAARSAEASSTVWLADACRDLADQVEAYAARNARHDRIRVASLIAEIHARVQLGGATDSALAGMALGTETAGETPLRRSRLVGLGARVTANGDAVSVDVYFSEIDTNAVYLMRHQWPGELLTGHAVAGRRVAGTTIGMLASSTIVTESAVRRANRSIRLGRRGIGKTSILPLGADAWADSAALSSDYDDVRRQLTERRPSFARNRLVTDGVGIVSVDAVVDTDYSPAGQTLTVVVADGKGSQAQIVVEHRAEAPGAIDAVLHAMSSGPRAVAGRMSARSGQVCITPYSIACDLGVVVPDLAPRVGMSSLIRSAGEVSQDRVVDAVAGCLSTLADLSHRGLRFVSEADVVAIRGRADLSRSVGMKSTGLSLDRLADALTGHDLEASADAWVRAVLRLVVADEFA